MSLRAFQPDDHRHAVVYMHDGHLHRVATSCGCCKEPATRKCDWKLRPGVTCSMPLCDEHAHAPTLDQDLCPGHSTQWSDEPEQIGLI